MANQNDDPFSDVRGTEHGYGSLAGGGVEQHYAAKVEGTNDGIDIKATCDHCGRFNVVSVSWIELAFIMNGALPSQEWVYDRAARVIRPYIGCPGCRNQIEVGLTPDECAKLVKAGVAGQRVSGQQIAQVNQSIAQQRQAQR